MSSWYKQRGKEDDIVVSTRIRIARNLVGIPFPGRMNDLQRDEVNRQVRDAVAKGSNSFAEQLQYIDMESVPEAEAYAMVERHMISPAFAERKAHRALLLSRDESISIMLGEEDHIRIQVIRPGLALDEAYEVADQVDRLLCQHLKIAFDPKIGFLTECPTNLGTGLRASVMLHLPVLEESGEVAALTESVGKIGLTVRGMYGEGSRSAASLYQLSNQITLGISEHNAIENLKTITMQLVERERAARTALPKIQLEDAVWRAYGLLANQRILSSEEMMKHLSWIKLGVSMGILNLDPTLPISLLIEGQPAMLQKTYGIMTPADRDINRAGMIRERLR